MARTYSEMVSLVRDWSNRDEEAVSDTVIKDCLRFAADRAYRSLRIPPLENVAIYEKADLVSATKTGNALLPSRTEIQLPVDLIEFIQIREVDANEMTVRVFNEKVDIRTFNDPYANRGSSYWARERNILYLAPGFADASVLGTPEKVHLYYYRRLPALDATYAVTVLNFNAGFLTETGVTTDTALYIVTSNGVDTAYAKTTDVPSGDTYVTKYYKGNAVYNWLRDDNEKILLYGALAEVFSYTQEDDQFQKYTQLFMKEIAELNDEDGKRNASGGNIQVNFNGRGLI
jgi:hypothetical protein